MAIDPRAFQEPRAGGYRKRVTKGRLTGRIEPDLGSVGDERSLRGGVVYTPDVAAAAIRTVQAEATTDPSLMPNAMIRVEDATRVVHAGQPQRSRRRWPIRPALVMHLG